VLVWADTYYEIFPDNPATHVAPHHKRQAAEHSLFTGCAFFRQNVANSFRRILIKSHYAFTRYIRRLSIPSNQAKGFSSALRP
jgi:hypothetical protein